MKLLPIFLVLSMWVAPAYGVVIGSNTVVSKQSLATFPAADVDNEMRGFASFAGGFTMEN